MLAKQKRWKSRKYLDWVKRQECIHPMCSAPADDPHHLIGVGGRGGMGLTAPDMYTMPLCRRHHDEIHDTPSMWPEQWQWICRTLERAINEGVLK